MLQSQLFTKTRREAPKDEVSKNAELLIRAGFINKEMAGVYSFLPLGWKTLNKIVGIIREEMNAIGGQEIYLSALQDKDTWEASGRWNDDVVDNWFKTELKNGTKLGLGFTHEEPLTKIMTNFVRSYRDLPIYAYQFQTKFRNEVRAKSGLMRGREFLMKDLYSFSKDKDEHDAFYKKAQDAYIKIFSRVGLGDITYFTFASGGTFSKFSHEFQTATEAGEDLIHVCEKCKVAINDEVFADQKVCPQCGNEKLKDVKAVEVGNIFTLGTKFSEALNLNYLNTEGKPVPVFMGSYGIGPGRLMGTVVEVRSDEKGIIWPKEVAPFDIHVVEIPGAETKAEAIKIYEGLRKAGYDVLYDDRDLRAGEKLSDADLIGIPWRVVVGGKSLEKGGVEVKARNSDKAEIVKKEEIFQFKFK